LDGSLSFSGNPMNPLITPFTNLNQPKQIPEHRSAIFVAEFDRAALN
jgi:hypothetical protein